MDQYQPLLDEWLLRMQPDPAGAGILRAPVTGNPQDEAQFKLNTADFMREPASAVQTSALPVPGDVNPLARMASISAAGETGTTDFGKGQFNISPDTGGSRSYGIFGLNSGFGRSAGGGSAGQFASSYPSLGLTARPGTPQFDAQWKTAASTMPDQLQGAQLDWYQKNILPRIGEGLTKAGVPDTVSSDPRVQAYFADRSVQQGPQSTLNHASRIARAAQASNGDPAQFLRAMSAEDRMAIPGDFRTYLAARPQDVRGLANRVATREQMAMGLGSENNDMPLSIPRNQVGGSTSIPTLAGGDAPPVDMLQGPSTGNLPFGIPGTFASNPIQQALNDNFSTLLAFAGGARQGGIGQGLTQAAKASLTADQQRSLDLQRAQDMAWRRFEAQRAQANTDRAFGQQVSETQRAQANTDRAFGLTRQQFEEGKLPTGYRKTEDGKGMEFIPNGPADPTVIRAQAEAKVGGGLLDADTINQMAQQYRAGDTSVLTNLGRGAQGAENIKLLRGEITRQNNAAGVTGAQQAQTNAEMQGERAFQRATGTRQAGVAIPAAEFEQMAPIARELSDKVNRTQYPSLNALILAAEKGTGSEDVIRYGTALKSLANIYSRVISPTGASTDQTRATAYELVNTAYSKGQVNAAIDIMEREIQAAKKGTQEAQKEHRQQRTAPAGSPEQSVLPAVPAGPAAAPAGIIRMERGPDGLLRRVQQ